MLQVVTSGDEYMDEIIIGDPTKSHFDIIDFLPYLYAFVSLFFLMSLSHLLLSIFLLQRRHQKIYVENIYFINTDAAKGTPFSFFKYIFWNKQIDVNSPNGTRIFKHEIAHVQQRHSWDKMFVNVVLIVFWCNPFFWLIRKELAMIHEFIADKHAVEDADTTAFAAMILQATYPQKNFYITNSFFYSPIKRRLMMLTKNQHPRMNYISRLLALPLLVILFGAFTIKIANKIDDGAISKKLGNKMIVVIDAGHGGKDAGVTNKNGITEKDLALQLVKKIKALNTDENIEIILTRDIDIYEDPKAKADFAKNRNADLFISVHLDNTPKAKWNSVSGMNVFVAREGVSNVEKSKILGAVILNTFKENYELPVPSTIVQRQVGVWIIQANTFPSILIEAGYLTNDKDAAYLLSEKGQEAFAKNVLDAIRKYSDLKSLNTYQIDKLKVDSPPSVKIEIKQVESSDRNEELLKNPRMTEMILDLDHPKNILSRGGIVLINNVIYNLKDLQNKVIKGRQSKVYKKGDTEMIKKYGANAANGIIIVEDGTIEDLTVKEKTNGYKNSLKFSTDTIIFLDENGSKIDIGLPDKKTSSSSLIKEGNLNTLYVIDGKISDRKALELILPNNILSINVLKGNSAILLYGEKGKNGVIEITTKKTPITKYGAAKSNAVSVVPSKSDNNESIDMNDEIVVVSYQSEASKGTLGTNDVGSKKTTINESGKIVFTKAEIPPSFPGGVENWKKYLMRNIDGNIAVKEGLKPGHYTFITTFIVQEDGSLSNFFSENSFNKTISQYCIDIISTGPKWNPAIQNGHFVAAYRKQPITFVVPEEDNKQISKIIDPVFRIGNLTKSSVSISDFVIQKYATVTDNFELNEATVYFSGSGFSKIETAKLKGPDLTKLKVYLDKCLSGTSVAFTNIKVKNASGVRVIEDRVYSLY